MKASQDGRTVIGRDHFWQIVASTHNTHSPSADAEAMMARTQQNAAIGKPASVWSSTLTDGAPDDRGDPARVREPPMVGTRLRILTDHGMHIRLRR